MTDYAVIFIGSGIGAIARYTLGGIVLHQFASWRFPLGTFAVNVVGCLIVGLLAGAVERYGVFSPQARLFLFTGLIGGFTTFSAFGLETVALARRGDLATALGYVALSVVCGLAMTWLGMVAVARS